jgi:cell division transport system permease protein
LNTFQTQFAYHIQAILHSVNILCRKPLATVMTIIVLALALALPALFLVLTDNLSKLTVDWQRGGHISLYLKANMTEADEKVLIEKLRVTTGVGDVTYKSAKMGLDELTKLEGMQDIMRYLPENPLPAVLEIIPALTVDSPAKLNQLYRELKANSEVDQAKLDMDWVNRLHAIFAFLTKIAHALIVLLALAVVLIISNTLRLAIHHRHEEIRVLKLVGAADAYITRPFLYQGVWYGLGSALLALFLVNIFMISLEMAVNQLAVVYKINFPISGLSIRQILLLFLFASILGWLGARLSVKRQLASIEPY